MSDDWFMFTGILDIPGDVEDDIRSDVIAYVESKSYLSILAETAIDIDWQSSGRKEMLSCLKFLAEKLLHSDGEIECLYYIEAGNPFFEYYTIDGGKVFCQRAQVIRDGKKEVTF